ncbi:hypothetical protein VPH35_093811 [Triticum aestivum]|uniref:MATH domain-containing protein n=1 Tax=Triticum aestivum TaxID=4565 RepID=A0A3B6LWT5_WHEAT
MGVTLDRATSASSGGGVDFYIKPMAAGSHLFQIDGYSIAKRAANGFSFKSCPFMVGGYRWALYLYPNGDRPDSAGFISVFLLLDDYEHVERPARLQLELRFIDEADKRQDPTPARTSQVIDLRSFCGVGYRRFIAREAMENSKHLKGDRFTIRCDLVFLKLVVIPENVHASGHRKCVACNLRVVTLAWMPLLHACFCVACKDASRMDATAKQCASCHGPFQGIFLHPGVPPLSSS